MFGNVGGTKVYWIVVGILGAIAFIWTVPTIFMVSLSLQSDQDLIISTANMALGLIPWPFTIENYVRLLSYDDTPRWFLNSIIVACCSTALVLILSSAAGFAFARLKFVGRDVLYAFVLAGMMIPAEGVFISLYTMFADWKLHSTYFSLISPNLALPLGTILMTRFFKGIPKELEDAAEVDGASLWTIYSKIMIPMSLPALTTLGIVTFLWTWNSYLWPLVTAQSKEMYTVTVGLASTQQGYIDENTGRIMAQGVIASFPVVVLFLVFQRYLVRGIVLQSK
ncbi:MAG: carbohydrate ABC transporter permease [Pseudomonadota bacterium]